MLISIFVSMNNYHWNFRNKKKHFFVTMHRVIKVFFRLFKYMLYRMTYYRVNKYALLKIRNEITKFSYGIYDLAIHQQPRVNTKPHFPQDSNPVLILIPFTT